ncbi:MAG TPA: tRNA uridine-5-carboxymethylaminomethyl(34) synthesis GTPase MnmE [Verrucomicrobiae bacterium]|nr:tRNA uridine-5-carboxymethylaminomethyl(34) synthesis GTPase MnmE [Verrucomicrobiae bacterium]
MPAVNLDDTIAAVATPPGEGGIAVIRISGPASFPIAGRVFRPAGGGAVSDFPSHTVHAGNALDGEGKPIDQVLLSVFRNPKSYTGQDVVEISAHGGLGITRKILDCILENGARMAEPGEFTKRAFLNGKMDLTQAEAVIDLIKARSEKSRETALRQLEGALSRKFNALRESLMKVYAHMEAFLDFPEEDLEIYSDQAFDGRFGQIKDEIRKLIASFRRGSVFREGVRCVILGKPNAGKSSLFNALLERDRALVSEYAGTTRDMLEECIEIGGIAVRLMDTAGLGHESTHPLDVLGSQRTREALEGAELVLFVVDGSAALEDKDREVFSLIRQDKPVLVLVNKSDLPRKLNPAELEKITGRRDSVFLSAKSRDGMAGLERKMTDSILGQAGGGEGEEITRLRHKKALEAALESLERAHAAFRGRESLEIVTLDVKAALDQMSELVGEIYSEDLLDVIFSEFCIGK